MARRNRRQTQSRTPHLLQELQANFSLEVVGVALVVTGVYLLFALFTAPRTPWIEAMMGWTAPWLALGMLVMGGVLILGKRAGYWSPEALVGAELLLLSLQAGTFVRSHPQPDWSPMMTGEDGGIVGWALGNLLVAGLGPVPGMALLIMVGLMGVWTLVMYTPLIYLQPLFLGGLAALHNLAQRVGWRLPPLPRWPRQADAAGEEGLFSPAVSDASPRQSSTRSASTAHPQRMALRATENFVKPFFDPDAELTSADSEPTPDTARRPASKKKKPAATPTSRPLRQPGELPPLDLLAPDSGVYGSKDVDAMSQLIERTLEDFNVPVQVVNVESGPTVTQFGVEPLYLERAGQRRKIRVNRIVSLADDLALALATRSVRIEAPVPGRPFVGIEVPNVDKSLVGLRDMLESAEFTRRGGELPMALGRDTSGAPIVADLTRAPHMLIAGATGAGKSVCLNAIITSLLMRHGPESLQFIMVDPKMVELPGYNGIPHLLGKVITDVEQVAGALTWMLLQMDDRYRLFQEAGVRNITAYNTLIRRRKDVDSLPYLVLIVDELADLMMTAPEEIERQLCRLAQMARATGIHLVLATQRPSTDVVTGLIKANFPTRIAFAVTSQIDSRVILDTPGAEKLLGQGDMLLMRPDASKMARVQGCWVSDSEIEKIADFWRSSETGAVSPVIPWAGLMDRMDDDEELILEAIDVVREMENCSTSMLQRKLRIGYPKAARLMGQLEARRVVGPDLGGGQGRAVLVGKNEDEDDDEEADEL